MLHMYSTCSGYDVIVGVVNLHNSAGHGHQKILESPKPSKKGRAMQQGPGEISSVDVRMVQNSD